MIERGNFEPLSPKKNLILKILILITAGLIIRLIFSAPMIYLYTEPSQRPDHIRRRG
jgi:hypothetical protein